MVRIRLGDLIEKGNLKMAGHIDRDLPQWLGIDDLSFEFPVPIDAAMITHIGRPELMPEITLDLWESVEKAMNERPVGQLTIRNWGTDGEPYYQIEAITIEYRPSGQQPKTEIVYREGEMPADFVPASKSPTGRAMWTRLSPEQADNKSESQSFLSENLEQGKCGYIDKTGRVVIATQFDNMLDLESFYDGLALVKVGGKYGYIDKTGQVVITPQFETAYSFYSEGLAAVKVGGKEGYIDKTGRVVITPQFEWASNFSEGLAAVKVGGKEGYIDKTGQVVITPQFEWASNFSEGLAAVEVGGKKGYIDKTGQVVITPQFERASNFSEGLAIILVGGKYGCIDKTGRLVITPQFETVYSFYSEGLAAVAVGDKSGYIDKTGRMVIAPQFDFAEGFFEGLARVGVGDKHGYIDKTGRMVIAPQFEKSRHFSDGLAMVKASTLGGGSSPSARSVRSSKTSQSTKKDGCFIVTAVYGSYNAPEVLTLRNFRDDVLLASNVGRALVKLYYILSPPVARLLNAHLWLRNMVRKAVVQPIISLVRLKFY
jgi:hypothetical protein